MSSHKTYGFSLFFRERICCLSFTLKQNSRNLDEHDKHIFTLLLLALLILILLINFTINFLKFTENSTTRIYLQSFGCQLNAYTLSAVK